MWLPIKMWKNSRPGVRVQSLPVPNSPVSWSLANKKSSAELLEARHGATATALFSSGLINTLCRVISCTQVAERSINFAFNRGIIAGGVLKLGVRLMIAAAMLAIVKKAFGS